MAKKDKKEVRKTNYEIMVEIMKSLKVSSFDLKEIDRQLTRNGAEPDDNGTYADSDWQAVVNYFKLEQEKKKSDKALIKDLHKQIKTLQETNDKLQEKNDDLTAKLDTLKSIKSTVDEINTNLGKLNADANTMAQKIEADWAEEDDDEDTTDNGVSEDQQENYSANQYENNGDLFSQQSQQ